MTRIAAISTILLLACPTIQGFTPTWSFSGATRRRLAGRLATTTTSTTLTASTSTAPTTQQIADGILKTVTVPGEGDLLARGDIATVKYSCYALPGTNSDENEDENYVSPPPFAKSSRQKVVVGDGAMIEGWERALRTMRVGERSVIRITDPNLAYGAMGVPPVVPPHAAIEVDLQVLEAQPVATVSRNIDFDSLVNLVDQTPTTAAGIAAAFEKRQAAKAASQGPALEGLDYWIDKVRNFYFFGLFEGETGERPPWFLRPSITFPLAFLIVGAAFYVTFIGGAIYERGAQVTDELDEIILSRVDDDISSSSSSAWLLAVNLLLLSLSSSWPPTHFGM